MVFTRQGASTSALPPPVQGAVVPQPQPLVATQLQPIIVTAAVDVTASN